MARDRISIGRTISSSWLSFSLSEVFHAWAIVEPEWIEAAIAALPPGRTRQRLFAEHAGRLAETDPAAARAWAMTGGTPEDRNFALTESAHAVARHNAAAAIELLHGLDPEAGLSGSATVQLPDGTNRPLDNRIKIFDETLATLARDQPQAAMSVASSMRNEIDRRLALDVVFETWANTDPHALSTWLATAPADAARIQGTETLVQAMLSQSHPDFPAALRWAATLPENNTGPLVDILRRWRSDDPETPMQELSTLGFSPERLRRVMQELRQDDPFAPSP